MLLTETLLYLNKIVYSCENGVLRDSLHPCRPYTGWKTKYNSPCDASFHSNAGCCVSIATVSKLIPWTYMFSGNGRLGKNIHPTNFSAIRRTLFTDITLEWERGLKFIIYIYGVIHKMSIERRFSLLCQQKWIHMS